MEDVKKAIESKSATDIDAGSIVEGVADVVVDAVTSVVGAVISGILDD